MSTMAQEQWRTELDSLIDARVDAMRNKGIDIDGVRARAGGHAAGLEEKAAPQVLALVTFAAALHDVLAENGSAGAVEAVAEIMSAPWNDDPSVLEGWLSVRYGVDPAAPSPAAWDEAAVKFKTRGEAVFGSDFVYEQEVLDADRSWVNVTSCFINDFMRRLGKAELTPVFCAFDNLIADQFDRAPAYGIKFEQLSTMGKGSDKCRFHFTRVSTAE